MKQKPWFIFLSYNEEGEQISFACQSLRIADDTAYKARKEGKRFFLFDLSYDGEIPVLRHNSTI